VPSAVLLKEPSKTAKDALMTIVVEFPEEFKQLAVEVAAVVQTVVEQRKVGPGGRAVDYAIFEDRLAEACARVERAGHGAALEALDVDGPAIFVEGVRHGRAGRVRATYYTLAGPVELERTLYRNPQGRTVDAVSLRAGVVKGGWLPKTARAMAHELQKGTSREAEATARELKRLPYSRTAFEHVAHEVGAHYVARHQDIEERLIEAFVVPDGTASVCVSLDRVSVPMEEPRPRPPGRPRRGAPKRPVARVFRMAYCGTLTLCDASGEALHTLRYGRMPENDAQDLCEGMAADAQHLLRNTPELKVQLLCDGAPEMWNLLRAAFSEVVLGKKAHENVDFHHLIEKLGVAAKVTHREDGSATTERWKLRLLNSSVAASEILAELIASGGEHVRVGDAAPVHDARTYLTNHAARLDYAEARRLGLPIGSGPVEATCKSLFNVRFKRSGSRWKTKTAEHVVQLRALALSDRWAPAIGHALDPLRKAISRAA
jgi:hypothetical protein